MDRPQYSEADIQAIRAVDNGSATPDQQKRAMNYIINYASQAYDMCWRIDPSMKDLALGQALVGQHIVHMIKHAKTKTSADKIAARNLTEPKP